MEPYTLDPQFQTSSIEHQPPIRCRENSAHTRQSRPDSGLGLSPFSSESPSNKIKCSLIARQRGPRDQAATGQGVQSTVPRVQRTVPRVPGVLPPRRVAHAGHPPQPPMRETRQSALSASPSATVLCTPRRMAQCSTRLSQWYGVLNAVPSGSVCIAAAQCAARLAQWQCSEAAPV